MDVPRDQAPATATRLPAARPDAVRLQRRHLHDEPRQIPGPPGPAVLAPRRAVHRGRGRAVRNVHVLALADVEGEADGAVDGL